jgi:hypothetical protein
MDKWREPLERLRFAVAPGCQELRKFVSVGVVHLGASIYHIKKRPGTFVPGLCDALVDNHFVRRVLGTHEHSFKPHVRGSVLTLILILSPSEVDKSLGQCLRRRIVQKTIRVPNSFFRRRRR